MHTGVIAGTDPRQDGRRPRPRQGSWREIRPSASLTSHQRQEALLRLAPIGGAKTAACELSKSLRNHFAPASAIVKMEASWASNRRHHTKDHLLRSIM